MSRVMRTKAALLAAAATISLHQFATAEEAPPVIPAFAEETASSGISSVYKGEWLYMVGGGAAVFDCNGDEYPDALLAGGERPP